MSESELTSLNVEQAPRCNATTEAEFGTAKCGRHESHDGPHSDLTPAGMISYRWEHEQ